VTLRGLSLPVLADALRWAEAVDRWRADMRALGLSAAEVDAALTLCVSNRIHDGGVRPLTHYLEAYMDRERHGREARR
jgi:hypothetical protein